MFRETAERQRSARVLSRGDAVLERLLRSVFPIVDFFVSLLGPGLVLAASGMLGYVVVTFFKHTLPYYTENYSPLWWFHTVVGLSFLFLVFNNYFRAIFTHPGTPPLELPAELVEEARQVNELLHVGPEVRRRRGKKKGEKRGGEVGGGGGGGEVGGGDGGEGGEERRDGATASLLGPTPSDWCKLCDAPKPPRTHHDHVRGVCVLGFDHYCPWVANSVGFRNYRFFYLFMFWMWLGSVYVVGVMYAPFSAATRDRHMEGRTGITFAYVCAIALFFALGLMLAWQTYLIGTAQTTIEFYQNRDRVRRGLVHGIIFRNPFDLGWAKNWQVIFGPSSYPLQWAMPWAPPPPGNGIQWPTIKNPNPNYIAIDTTAPRTTKPSPSPPPPPPTHTQPLTPTPTPPLQGEGDEEEKDPSSFGGSGRRKAVELV